MSQDPNNEDLNGEENLAFLAADHPLLRRFQVELTKQLTAEHERVD